jgi:DNA-binding NarL/FixJ family response regulator
MPPKAQSRGDGTAETLRIILVDDHPIMRAGVKALLNAEPGVAVVAEADNGQTAVELAQELRPDLVLMDVSLPQLNGAEATRQILAAQPSLKVLALSAHEDAAFARLMLEAGALGYVLKRSASDELVRGIRVVAAGNTYIDPVLSKELFDGSRVSRRRSPRGVPIASLSDREAEVVRLTAQGHTCKEMAQSLGLSPRTLETYKARAMGKLRLTSRADLVRYALRCGWLRES